MSRERYAHSLQPSLNSSSEEELERIEVVRPPRKTNRNKERRGGRGRERRRRREARDEEEYEEEYEEVPRKEDHGRDLPPESSGRPPQPQYTPILVPCGSCRQWAGDVRTLPCGHIYCANCIKRILNTSSPYSPSPPSTLPHMLHGGGPGQQDSPSTYGILPVSKARSWDGDETDGYSEESDREIHEKDNAREAKTKNKRKKNKEELKETSVPETQPANRIPDRRRLWLRAFLLVASIGAVILAFTAGSPPEGVIDSVAFRFLSILPIVSGLLSLFSMVLYAGRRWRGWKKMNQLYMVLIDFFMTLFWAADLFVMFAKNSCPSGTDASFCNYYKGSVFFGLLVLFGHLVATGWDLYGWITDRQKKRVAAMRPPPSLARREREGGREGEEGATPEYAYHSNA